MITEFTPIEATVGGFLIGLSAVALMALNGRIAGMTGILGNLLPPVPTDWQWRAWFLAGAVVAPIGYLALTGTAPAVALPVDLSMVVISGLVVGFGVTFSSGCTSGHGVCGIARLSPRSIVATATFMITTFATVFVVRHVIGL